LHESPRLLRTPRRWTEAIFREPRSEAASGRLVVGVLPGEGIGPEVIAASLAVLAAVERDGRAAFDVRTGGTIGRDAEVLVGRPLTDEVARFCEEVFGAGGAVLAGPGGGRFVYDLRRRFDLFCKLSPIQPLEPLRDASRLKASALDGVDVLIVRENVGGVYMGEWRERVDEEEGRVCEHSFRYSERQVRRLLDVAAALAAARRGLLTVVVKDGGVPGVSALWRDLGCEAADRASVAVDFADIDLAAYRLVQHPAAFDVIAAPNLFGDVLSDVGAVLLSSRGVSFSGNFSGNGAAVYQTNHGSALDLAGRGECNPIGQIASLAMMLRESFGLAEEARRIERAIGDVLSRGFRTFDIAEAGATLVGTAEMGERIAAAVACSRPGG